MPRSRQARMTRTAISPRFATSTFENTPEVPSSAQLDVVEVDHDVVGRAGGQPHELGVIAQVRLDVRHVGRDEHELTLVHVDVLAVAGAEVDPGPALEHVAAGLG